MWLTLLTAFVGTLWVYAACDGVTMQLSSPADPLPTAAVRGTIVTTARDTDPAGPTAVTVGLPPGSRRSADGPP